MLAMPPVELYTTNRVTLTCAMPARPLRLSSSNVAELEHKYLARLERSLERSLE